MRHNPHGMRLVRPLVRVARALLILSGAGALLLTGCLAGGMPILLDRLVIEADHPVPARAIVCLAGGVSSQNLPLQDGWDRVYTAVQLQADGFAPTIVFSGGGTAEISEAEVYAEAARWLGTPGEAIVLDPRPGSTADHPRNLLELQAVQIHRDTPILVVTSPLHSKRVALCFRKAGFTNFRVVVGHEARSMGPAVARSLRRSAIGAYRPSGRRYDDPLNRLKWGLDRLLITIRELVAIGAYKLRGDA